MINKIHYKYNTSLLSGLLTTDVTKYEKTRPMGTFSYTTFIKHTLHNWTGSVVDVTPPYELTDTLQCSLLWLGRLLHQLTCAVTMDTTEQI